MEFEQGDVDYDLETSTDLSTWATAGFEILQIVSGEITLKATTPIDALDNNFYRLRVFEITP